MCDGFHDISCNQHLETKQERSANTDLVYLGILPTHWPPEMQIGGPSDSDDDDKHAEHLNPAPDHTDGLIGYRFDSLKSRSHHPYRRPRNARTRSRADPVSLPTSTFKPIATSPLRST